MKKLFSLLCVVSFFITGTAFAQSGMMGRSAPSAEGYTLSDQDAQIHTALEAIYKSQQIVGREQVDCSKVTDFELITLGDGVMGYGITEAAHTAMETMMGGEDAPMSKQAHLNMGRAYLGCWANYHSGPMMLSMMGNSSSDTLSRAAFGGAGYPGGVQGAMGQGFGGGWGMMGGFYGVGMITMILVWALLILSILTLVKWLKKK